MYSHEEAKEKIPTQRPMREKLGTLAAVDLLAVCLVGAIEEGLKIWEISRIFRDFGDLDF